LNDQNSFLSLVLAAFIGAVLAFLISRLGIFLDRIKKRNTKNYNALVKLEHLVNEWQTVIDDNRQHIEVFKAAMNQLGVLPLNRFEKIMIANSVKMDLQDIKLVNSVFGLEYSFRRLNQDAEVINSNLDSFREGVVSRNINPSQYLVLLKSTLGEISFLQAFMDELLDELAEVMAYVHIRLELDETFSMKLLKKISMRKKRVLTMPEVLKRKKKVLSQLEKSRTESIKKREEIISKIPEQNKRNISGLDR
jgi:hypothetical protein